MWDLIWPGECRVCEAPVAGILCHECGPLGIYRINRRITGIETAITSAPYSAPVGNAVKLAKYSRNRPLAAVLAKRFADQVSPILQNAPFNAIVPVPSHWRKRWHRGFEISALLAIELASVARRPVVHGLKSTGASNQAGIAGHQRHTTAMSRFRSRCIWRGGAVLLVDDVLTTGSTAEACAQELLGSGVSRVFLATLCAARPSETSVQIL